MSKTYARAAEKDMRGDPEVPQSTATLDPV